MDDENGDMMQHTIEKKSILDEVVKIITDPKEFSNQAHLLEIMAELPNVNLLAARGESSSVATRTYIRNQCVNPDPGIASRARYLFGALMASVNQRK